jgi:hypothetical protein
MQDKEVKVMARWKFEDARPARGENILRTERAAGSGGQ